MSFNIDKQTLEDLNILESNKYTGSIYSFFNRTQTYGGRERLCKIISRPTDDIKTINDRQDIIRFFLESSNHIEFDKEYIDFAEYYLSQDNYPTKQLNYVQSIERKIKYRFKNNEEYYIIQRGILAIFDTIVTISSFYDSFTQRDDIPEILSRHKDLFIEDFKKEDILLILGLFRKVSSNKNRERVIKAQQISYFDHAFRYTKREQIRALLDIVYEYDICMSAAKTAIAKGLCMPNIKDSQEKEIRISGLFHPMIKDAITSDIHLDNETNILFLTGPNMAGKSTFLKALSLSVYLSHIGFPVPAKRMSISLFNGLSTSINLADNINMGQSHFYAEVSRIKQVALAIKKYKRMFVVIDELFRGTNVKDAYEGSLAITNSFAGVDSCLFAISTHIIEVAEKLDMKNKIKFAKFDVTFIDKEPQYTYTLQDGISEDRLGMYIINKENIIETIKSINETI